MPDGRSARGGKSGHSPSIASAKEGKQVTVEKPSPVTERCEQKRHDPKESRYPQ